MEKRRIGSYIYDYDERMPFVKIGFPENNRYFGVELEIDGGKLDRFRMYLNGNPYLDDKGFLVYDGSLSRRGIEFVSNPMSLSEHITSDFWEIVVEYARMADFSSHDTDTCGLHVHVSREGLSEEAIDNIIFLNERFWSKWITFSRRESDEIQEWARKLTSYTDKSVTKRAVKEESDKSRYRAINVTGEDTIEFRIFKGSLRLSTIKASIELVDFLVEFAIKYANNDSLDIESITWGDILQEVNSYSSEYTYLKKYLVRIGLAIEELGELLDKDGSKSNYISNFNEVYESVRTLLDNEDINLYLNNNILYELISVGNYRSTFRRMPMEGDKVVIINDDDNPFGSAGIVDYTQVMEVERVNHSIIGRGIYSFVSRDFRGNMYNFKLEGARILHKISPIELGDITFNYVAYLGEKDFMLLNFDEDGKVINIFIKDSDLNYSDFSQLKNNIFKNIQNSYETLNIPMGESIISYLYAANSILEYNKYNYDEISAREMLKIEESVNKIKEVFNTLVGDEFERIFSGPLEYEVSRRASIRVSELLRDMEWGVNGELLENNNND